MLCQVASSLGGTNPDLEASTHHGAEGRHANTTTTSMFRFANRFGYRQLPSCRWLTPLTLTAHKPLNPRDARQFV